MTDNNVINLSSLGAPTDSLTEFLKHGAQKLLRQALEAEVELELERLSTRRTDQGLAGVVRSGYQPERQIQTGIGPVTVKVPKIRARDGKPISFRSALVPPFVRKTRSLEAAIPWLYLKGVSSGEMQDALKVLVGPEAEGLSASTVSRLKQCWADEYKQWREKPLHKDQWIYVWADGIHSGLRADDTKLCCLVIMGVNERGEKHFLAIEDGVRESTQSWKEVLLKLQSRGMNTPHLGIGDGALGFWAALDEVYPDAIHQRCWQHKANNVINYLPKKAQAKARESLTDIWQAETKDDAEKSFDLFIAMYEDKYPKASRCLEKDRLNLLGFYDFPAKHWQSIRTTNPIESAFATIRHRTKRSKGCLSRETMLHMMFKLGECAQKRWHRLRGFDYLAKVIEGVQFKDGIEVTEQNQNAA